MAEPRGQDGPERDILNVKSREKSGAGLPLLLNTGRDAVAANFSTRKLLADLSFNSPRLPP